MYAFKNYSSSNAVVYTTTKKKTKIENELKTVSTSLSSCALSRNRQSIINYTIASVWLLNSNFNNALVREMVNAEKIVRTVIISVKLQNWRHKQMQWTVPVVYRLLYRYLLEVAFSTQWHKRLSMNVYVLFTKFLLLNTLNQSYHPELSPRVITQSYHSVGMCICFFLEYFYELSVGLLVERHQGNISFSR